MAVRQVSKDKITKDGRKWQFYLYIKYPDGTRKKYFSKNYSTRHEAEVAEKKFALEVENKEINLTDMTFQDLYDEFYAYKLDKVKHTTIRTYQQRIPRLKMLMNIKIRDFDIQDYLKWRAYISSLPIKIKTKNSYHKLLKELLNYGTKWHDFNFTTIYNKMEKFSDPNALPEEMGFYTFEEFKQFISVEDNIEWKCAFEILYYCGLRRGELRGLTWDNIDFFNKTLSVNKNITNSSGDSGEWILTTPKTKSSYRTIPMPDILIEDLKEYKETCKKYPKFNSKFFVFGGVEPIKPDTLRLEKIRIAEKAGVKQIRLHDFRHSCASLLINSGANVMIVAKYLGHTKIDETLNTYSHLFKNKMEDVVNTMNSLN